MATAKLNAIVAATPTIATIAMATVFVAIATEQHYALYAVKKRSRRQERGDGTGKGEVMELGKVLDDLINGRQASATLPRGLGFQFKVEAEKSKLCVYRVGNLGPSEQELKIVHATLDGLLPGRVIKLGDPFTHTGKDGKPRQCRVFSWFAGRPVAASQLGLGVTGATAVTETGYKE